MQKIRVMEKPQEVVLLETPVFWPPVESAKDREWFNRVNQENAEEAFQCMVHAEHNGMQTQVDIRKDEVRSWLNKDRAEDAVFQGRVMDWDSGLFACKNIDDPQKPFTIKGDKFDWDTFSVELSGEKIPLFALERATMLRSRGVIPDFFAVAGPGEPNYLPTSHNLKEETKRTLHDVARVTKQAGGLALRLGLMAGEALGKAGSTVAPVAGRVGAKAVGAAGKGVLVTAGASAGAIAAFLKDPVLLACFGLKPCFIVEIGRWD